MKYQYYALRLPWHYNRSIWNITYFLEICSCSPCFVPFRPILLGKVTIYKDTIYFHSLLYQCYPSGNQCIAYVYSYSSYRNSNDQTDSHCRILVQHQVNSAVEISKTEVQYTFDYAFLYKHIYLYIYKYVFLCFPFRWNVIITGLLQKILLHMGTSQWRCCLRRSTQTGFTGVSELAT